MSAGPEDAVRWRGAGPLLDDDVQEQVRAALLAVGEPTGDELGHTGALEVVTEAVTASLARGEVSGAKALVHVERQLRQLAEERTDEAFASLARVLERLEAAPCTVSGLLETIPRLVCELGFSRALISRVEDDVWTPELMYVVGDPDSSSELTRVGKSSPQALEPGQFETEAVRTRVSVLATDVQAQPWRSHPALADASHTRSYVVAPLLSGAEVVGLLHAERYAQQRDVDELDRQVLTAFAASVRTALSRARLAEELEQVQRVMAAATRTAGQAVAVLHAMPRVRVTREPGQDQDAMLVRSGPPGLPAELSRRELEVLELMAAGKANGAIARQLTIAEGTVKQHVKHILRKLMVGSRAEAVARWFQAGGVAPHG